jgi:hypothetical protein
LEASDIGGHGHEQPCCTLPFPSTQKNWGPLITRTPSDTSFGLSSTMVIIHFYPTLSKMKTYCSASQPRPPTTRPTPTNY